MSRKIVMGLLVCDHVADRFQHLDGDYPAIFPALFARIGATVEWRIYDVSAGEFPAAIDECDAYMTTGSRASAYEARDWIIRLKEFIRDLYRSGIPLIGICFGHQVIAEALGGRVAKATTGWGVGVHPVTIDCREVWMEPFEPTPGLLYLHQDQVVELPPGAVNLGHSDHCPVAIYRIDQQILCIQAHPELSRPYLAAVLEDRRPLIGDAKVDAALAVLSNPTHELAIARWIVRFLNRSLGKVIENVRELQGPDS